MALNLDPPCAGIPLIYQILRPDIPPKIRGQYSILGRCRFLKSFGYRRISKGGLRIKESGEKRSLEYTSKNSS